MAPIKKSLASSTSKSGTGLSSKTSKTQFGSTTGKGNSHGSTGKSSSSKLSNLGSSGSNQSFPTTSKKKYETVSYNPKTGKHSTSLGIIWIPTKKRNKKKEVVYNSMNYDKTSNRVPSMYSYDLMSGDSPDFQLHKKKEEETKLVSDGLRGPIATVASAGAVIAEVPSETSNDSAEEKLLKTDDDTKKLDQTDKDSDYLDNNDEVSKQTPESKQIKSTDKVDSVYSTTSPIKPPLQSEPMREEEDCGINCLYYTLLCCDCVLM